ncbi:tRNA glutamyl-Q(34) synthetase GluQRS [Aestuariibacter sp. AA17]|uniref:tRNA glutamyl-Q(34) synthetase GluQRS n=1 Tax=Fluctibacter corallii TaxID=2984329 RepID=A0ABT3ABK9_9ALTE|nr:tRNA glutamyl-Q(34) synthetase GluQRS [Aestuariibacter sp. AA17]MCV2885652.1 tRNA glutamyl-Q(34) synthetase GluQRS [Aestuariibacter sp. AA17]
MMPNQDQLSPHFQRVNNGNPEESKHSYIGRFAPSPSGPLHFGSLVTAVASYLQAKQNSGRWLVRIDDIDPPREAKGAKQEILDCLELHGLAWDECIYQSSRSDRYDSVLQQLLDANLAYFCSCTRSAIKARGGFYDGHCRDKHNLDAQCAIRFKNDVQTDSLHDQLLGDIAISEQAASEDFIIKRKDGLYAYHLASVIDDIDFGITEIVRGADLLAPSVCQQSLMQALGHPYPKFIHVPVAATKPGFKLSKQNHAKGISNTSLSQNLFDVLRYLNQPIADEMTKAAPNEILRWATTHWDVNHIPKRQEIIVNSVE